MTRVATSAESVGKRYRIGELRRADDLLVERLNRLFHHPVRTLRRMGGERSITDNELWALRDVSFELKPGEALGLIGRNGAGKTTLLKLLSRITPPTTGEIRIRGRFSSLLEVGTGFHPDLTGRENVYLNGAILGMSRQEIRRRFDAIVAFSGVERHLETPIKRYSSGMRMRLAFSVAAHLEPEIMMIDEVLAVGDAEFQRRCLGKMHEEVRAGRTVIFVSHNLQAVQRLCSRALLLEAGRVVMDGRPSDVVAEYSSRFGFERAGHAEIAHDAPRFGTGEVRIRAVQMLDNEGLPATATYLRQPIRIRMTVEALDLVPEAAIEIGISSLEGQRLITVQNIDGDRPPMQLKPGTHEIETLIDVSLLPNDYTIDLAVHTFAGRTMDLLERVLRFTALNQAVTGGDHYRWPVVRGYVRPESRWAGPRPAVVDRGPSERHPRASTSSAP